MPARCRWLGVVVTAFAYAPGVAVALVGKGLSDPATAAAYGVAIVGTAFLLAWWGEDDAHGSDL